MFRNLWHIKRQRDVILIWKRRLKLMNQINARWDYFGFDCFLANVPLSLSPRAVSIHIRQLIFWTKKRAVLLCKHFLWAFRPMRWMNKWKIFLHADSLPGARRWKSLCSGVYLCSSRNARPQMFTVKFSGVLPATQSWFFFLKDQCEKKRYVV